MKDFNSRFVSYKYRDNILFASYKKNTTISLEIAHLIVNERLEYQNGKVVKVLADCTGIKYMTKNARDYFNNHGDVGFSKIAIVIQSKIQRIIGNLYIKLRSSKTPSKLFTDSKSAYNWLIID